MFTISIFIAFINVTLHRKRDFARMMKVKDLERVLSSILQGDKFNTRVLKNSREDKKS